MTIVELDLKDLELDVELQPREEIDLDLVDAYADDLAAGAVFPAVVAFRNGSGQTLLADGWHRVYAYRKANREVIAADLREGDRNAALRHSLQSNAAHGKRRTKATLKRAYDLAVKHKLFDPVDIDAVMTTLGVSEPWAYRLADDAITERRNLGKSLAISMAARGMSQRKIAEHLRKAGMEVERQTVTDWVAGFSTVEKSAGASIPDVGALEELEAQLLDSMRREMEPGLRAKLLEELEAKWRKRIEAEENGRKKLADAAVRQHEKLVEQHTKQLGKLELAQAKERAAAEKLLAKERESKAKAVDALNRRMEQLQERLAKPAVQPVAPQLRLVEEPEEDPALSRLRQELEDAKAKVAAMEQQSVERAATVAAPAADLAEVVRRNQEEVFGPAATAWFNALKACEAATALKQDFHGLRHPRLEGRYLEEVEPAIARLLALKAIASGG